MKINKLLSAKIKPDWQGLLNCILRKGKLSRVYFIELMIDEEIKDAVAQKFNLLEKIDRADEAFYLKREIAIQKFLGYDYVRLGFDDLDFTLDMNSITDTAELTKSAGRQYLNEQTGPISDWNSYEQYPWPDPEKASTRSLDWYEDNLPDDMCVLIGNKNVGHFCQLLMGLFGYENLCYQLYDNRALVKAVSQKLAEINEKMMKIFMSFRRVKMIFVADDMGFRSGTLISPDDLREFVIPAHKTIAEIAHAHNIPYLLHSCGDIEVVIDDLINDVKIDGKHSFEDNIILISEAQKQYGDKIALLGGIDMDFLCRADEKTIRQRVRKTIELFNGTGGFCLGTGNSVANYIPLDNYLIMLDEGRNFV